MVSSAGHLSKPYSAASMNQGTTIEAESTLPELSKIGLAAVVLLSSVFSEPAFFQIR
jgi:hypothetical protein